MTGCFDSGKAGCELHDGGGGVGWLERAEETVLFVSEAAVEIERAGVAAASTVAEINCPKTFYLDRTAKFIVQGSEKGARGRIEGIDVPVASVSDKQSSRKNTE